MSDIIPTNVGGIDRLARMLLGGLVLSLYFFGPQSDWALLGLLPIASGAIGFCPLYTVFGIKTA